MSHQHTSLYHFSVICHWTPSYPLLPCDFFLSNLLPSTPSLSLLSLFLWDHCPLYFKVLEGVDLFISFVSKLLETPLLKLGSFLLALFKATLMIPIRVSSTTPGSQTEQWPLLLLWRDQSFQKLERSAACPVILAELLFWATFMCSPKDPLPPNVVGKYTFSPGTVTHNSVRESCPLE